MNEVAAAQLLGLKVATLRKWRHRKQGPAFVKFGRSVRYLAADLQAFIEGSRV
jgi:predicted DNA-binding transcriptional regulator AlpA